VDARNIHFQLLLLLPLSVVSSEGDLKGYPFSASYQILGNKKEVMISFGLHSLA
jgi:hypothetical protein